MHAFNFVQTLLTCTSFFHLVCDLFKRLLLTKRYCKNNSHGHESSPVIIDTCLNTKNLHWLATMTALALVVVESLTQIMVILVHIKPTHTKRITVQVHKTGCQNFKNLLAENAPRPPCLLCACSTGIHLYPLTFRKVSD